MGLNESSLLSGPRAWRCELERRYLDGIAPKIRYGDRLTGSLWWRSDFGWNASKNGRSK